MTGSIYPGGRKQNNMTAGFTGTLGELVMELRVHLKVCEGCGNLWYRIQNQRSVYCKECETRLREFPLPESRKRRGPRPATAPMYRMLGVAEAAGGVQ